MNLSKFYKTIVQERTVKSIRVFGFLVPGGLEACYTKKKLSRNVQLTDDTMAGY